MNSRRVVILVFVAVLVLAGVRAGSAKPAPDDTNPFAAADAPGSGRADGSHTSLASAPAHTKTGSLTPAARARAKEVTMTAAPWSTPSIAFMRFV